jgi:pimeloyl-ACP methyl ester carboxylesterase
VHLVTSSDDVLITPEMMRAMRLPDVGWSELKAGHLSNLEAPDAFNKAVLGVLEASAH